MTLTLRIRRSEQQKPSSLSASQGQNESFVDTWWNAFLSTAGESESSCDLPSDVGVLP